MTSPVAPPEHAHAHVHAPADAAARRGVAPAICYPPERLPDPDLPALAAARARASRVAELDIPPRQARCWTLRAGQFLRISCPDGPQVGDLNLWAADDLAERFYSGKTRGLHGTHLGTGDRLWSTFPHLRPMATIVADTLGWYGIDADGASVHDVIGTRCDPYTHRLLDGGDYHTCCHSNLVNALAAHLGRAPAEVEPLVHDVLNVFMCTGFTRDGGAYFTKATPARRGDHIEFYAEIDLLAALSACPWGDCSGPLSPDTVCHPLRVEVFDAGGPVRPPPRSSAYSWP